MTKRLRVTLKSTALASCSLVNSRKRALARNAKNEKNVSALPGSVVYPSKTRSIIIGLSHAIGLKVLHESPSQKSVRKSVTVGSLVRCESALDIFASLRRISILCYALDAA